jgi:hypothetical protein
MGSLGRLGKKIQAFDSREKIIFAGSLKLIQQSVSVISKTFKFGKTFK